MYVCVEGVKLGVADLGWIVGEGGEGQRPLKGNYHGGSWRQ